MMGAEVVTIEPPGGSAARRGGLLDVDGQSLLWNAYARGKRSATLDLTTEPGRIAFADLARQADVLIDSGPLSGLESDSVAEINPRLVHASISAHGRSGPKSTWQATDLTIAAACGFLSLTGDDDRPPVRISADQAFLHASLEAVAAILVALHERDTYSGLGQHIDVSAVESFMLACQYQMLGAALHGTSAKRIAGGASTGPVRLRFVFPCADGHVVVVLAFGSALGRFARNLMEWVYEEGFCDEATRDKDWIGYGLQLLTGDEPVEEWERVKEAVARFLCTKTKAELAEAAFTRRLVLCPVSTVENVLADEQFASRGVFSDEHGIRIPAGFALFDGERAPLRSPAPAAGSDHVGGFAACTEIPAAQPDRSRDGASNGALGGLRVLDLSWVMAGASGGRMLADYGATVVRVESSSHVDTIRTLSPYRDDTYDPDFSGPYNCANAGKLGLALNLSRPESKAVLSDLVRWADVVLDSYVPGVMAKLGFGAETLRELNPSAVIVSSSLLGQTGPKAGLAGYGNMGAALAGFTEITGWPDRDPAGPFAAYTDSTSPRFLAIATMAALIRRRETGRGTVVDLSQSESALHLLAPALIDAQRSGRVLQRAGNDEPMMSPHGVYAAADGGWLAIVCRNDAEWRRLCTLLDARHLTELAVLQRRDRADEIDDAINVWSERLDANAAMEQLQAIGVPAHAVQDSAAVFVDPQIVDRQYFREVAHATQPGGTTWIERHRPLLSRTPAQFERGAPTCGQHSQFILGELLGYSEDQITELAIAGCLE